MDNVKAYDAVYEQTTPVGKSTMRQMCDGKGHMRTETNMNGQKTVSILDFPNKTAITVMEAQKMYMKTPMSPETQKASISGHATTAWCEEPWVQSRFFSPMPWLGD